MISEELSIKMSAGVIQQALSDGDYAKALRLDPKNAAALTMKRRVSLYNDANLSIDVQRALRDRDSTPAMMLDPTNAKTRAAILKLPPIRNSIGMDLKLLPPGVFTMGDEDDEHEVTLTKPFMLGVHEVTQEQYEQVMRDNPSNFKGADNPVDGVIWKDAVEFCRKLSELPAEKAAGHVYRLPTEAEWEYACRAGTTMKFSFGDDASELGQYAWYSNNSDSRIHSVGGKKPNAWGLYDMHGNVWEWCQDGNASSYRVIRGGSWDCTAGLCRSASRIWGPPSFRIISSGFRVCLSPSGQ